MVRVPLVYVHDEDNVVTEAAYAVHCGHLDDKGEQIVYEGIAAFVDEKFPGQVRHGLELVINEQLRQHKGKAEGIRRSR